MKTFEEISREYGIKCAELGDFVFRYEDMGNKIEKLKLDLHNINVEALKIDKEMKKDLKIAEIPKQ